MARVALEKKRDEVMEAAEMMEAFLKEFPHMRSIVDVLPQVQPLDDGVLTRVRVTKVEDGQS